MRKLLGLLAVAAIVFSLGLPAAAQEVVSAKASRLTIGGSIDFDAVAREAAIFSVGPYDEHFVNTDLTIELTLDMTDNVGAFIKIRDDWICEEMMIDGLGGELANGYGYCYCSDVETYIGMPLSLPIEPCNAWSWDDYNLQIEEAYIDVREFLVPELDIRIGLQNLVWDLRGNGDEFLLNVNENHWGYYGPVEAGAWKATYDADPLMLEGFVATIWESLGYRDDHALYGAMATYPFDDMSKGQLGVLVYNADSSQMYAVDVGVDYWLNEDLELYAEGAWEFGNWLDWAIDEMDASGWGAYGGAMYTFRDVEWTPSVDLSYWYLSGDDTFDDDNEFFMSFEDVDTFAILEENHYGWDFDSNYQAFKFCGSAMPAEDLTADLKVGWFTLVEDEAYGYDEDALGIEVDASVTWQYSENLAFTGLVAYLFEAGLIKELVDDVGYGAEEAEDSGYLASFQTRLIF